jgi:hypothetical protein
VRQLIGNGFIQSDLPINICRGLPVLLLRGVINIQQTKPHPKPRRPLIIISQGPMQVTPNINTITQSPIDLVDMANEVVRPKVISRIGYTILSNVNRQVIATPILNQHIIETLRVEFPAEITARPTVRAYRVWFAGIAVPRDYGV